MLSHEKYEQLLAKAGVLLEGLVPERTAAKVAPAPSGPTTPTIQITETEVATGEVEVAAVIPTTTTTGDETETITTKVLIASFEERQEEAKTQAAAVAAPVAPRTDLEVRIPKVTRTVTARNFNLSTVSDAPFTDLGKRLAGGAGTTLERKRLDVVADDTAPTGYRLVPATAEGSIAASTPELPFGGAGHVIRNAILAFDFVPTDKPSLNAAKRCSDAVVAGAGGEQALASYVNAAIYACHQILKKAYQAAPPVVSTSIDDVAFGPVRISARPTEPNRFGPFSHKVAYSGWKHSLYPLDWFDSTPERTLANLMDDDDQVVVWTRIQRGEFSVEWEEGRYSPDFYALGADGTHYLLEVKADKDVDTATVQAKKKAAEEWARFITDHGTYGTWRYLLVPEKVLATAKTFPAVIAQASGS